MDHTRREAEDLGLEIVETLLAELEAIARSSRRSVRLLLSGQALGCVEPAGPDAVVLTKLEEWKRLVAAFYPQRHG